MRYSAIFILALIISGTMSCGQGDQEKAKLQKQHEDSIIQATLALEARQDSLVFSAQIDSLQTQLNSSKERLAGLNQNPDYLYVKSRLTTVRARVSTGGSYGWIDKDGKFWEGKDASKAFDDAARKEKEYEAQIQSVQLEIAGLEQQIKNIRSLEQK